MPIEFCYVPEGQTQEIGAYLLEPGEGSLLPDFSEGEERVVAISCNPNDEGGTIQILPAEGSVAEVGEGEVLQDEMSDPIGVIRLDSASRHEQEISDEDGNSGTLRVRHVGDCAVTAAGNIPRNLIYPN